MLYSPLQTRLSQVVFTNYLITFPHCVPLQGSLHLKSFHFPSRLRPKLNNRPTRTTAFPMSAIDPDLLAAIRKIAAASKLSVPWTRDTPYAQSYFSYNADHNTWSPSNVSPTPSTPSTPSIDLH